MVAASYDHPVITGTTATRTPATTTTGPRGSVTPALAPTGTPPTAAIPRPLSWRPCHPGPTRCTPTPEESLGKLLLKI